MYNDFIPLPFHLHIFFLKHELISFHRPIEEVPLHRMVRLPRHLADILPVLVVALYIHN